MCQGCVDEGRLSQVTYDKIEAFNDKYEWAQFGPAHIVLADDNIEDSYIDWCIGLILAVQAHRRKEPIIEEDMPRFGLEAKDLKLLQDLDWYDESLGVAPGNDGDEEMEATLQLLRELREIPEEER